LCCWARGLVGLAYHGGGARGPSGKREGEMEGRRESADWAALAGPVLAQCGGKSRPQRGPERGRERE